MKKLLLSLFIVLVLATFANAGTATFKWSPVTTNSDGSPCTDLAGYNVYDTTATRTKLNGATIATSVCTGSPVKCSWTYTYSGAIDNHKYVCTGIDTGNHEGADSNTATAVIVPGSIDDFIILFQ